MEKRFIDFLVENPEKPGTERAENKKAFEAALKNIERIIEKTGFGQMKIFQN